MFQYQKGAIKTAEWVEQVRGEAMFQYQKGAIKTDAALREASVAACGFNTKKVRLKQAGPAPHGDGSGHVSIPKRCD